MRGHTNIKFKRSIETLGNVSGLESCDCTVYIIDRKTDICEHLCRKYTHYFFVKVILVCHCCSKMVQLCHTYERLISGDVRTYPNTLLAFNRAAVSFFTRSVATQCTVTVKLEVIYLFEFLFLLTFDNLNNVLRNMIAVFGSSPPQVYLVSLILFVLSLHFT